MVRCALGALVAIAAVAAAATTTLTDTEVEVGDTPPTSEIGSHQQRELEENNPKYVLAAIDLGQSNATARQRYYSGDKDETEWPTYSPSFFPTLAPAIGDSTGGKGAGWHNDGWNDDGWRGGSGRKRTEDPTISPTIAPSLEPTLYPTIEPTLYPTIAVRAELVGFFSFYLRILTS